MSVALFSYRLRWLNYRLLDLAYFVPALPTATQYYTGPYADTFEADCYCSTITYQLYSACGACQGRPYISYALLSHIINCR